MSSDLKISCCGDMPPYVHIAFKILDCSIAACLNESSAIIK